MAKVKQLDKDGVFMSVWCPACNMEHTFRVKGDEPWTFNGDFEKPTFMPSMLMQQAGENPIKCHSFVKNGMIEFLGDCTHEMRNRTIELPDYPKDKL